MKSGNRFLVSALMLACLLEPWQAAGQEAAKPALQLEHALESRGNGSPPLTLSQALEEAAAKNPELMALRARAEAAGQKPAQLRSLAPPMLETTIWQWPTNTFNPANTNMYMFLGTQELPGSGKRELRVAVVQKDVAVAQNAVAARTREILGDVRQAYNDLFVARKAIEIHLANVELLRQLTDVSQAKYEAGRSSQQDVLKSVIELSRLHEDLIMLDQQAGAAAARLNTLLDRSIDAPIGPLDELRELILDTSLAELQAMAFKYQPQVDASRLAIERAEAEAAVARADYKPDYSVQAGYLLMPHQTDAWLARLSVTWPKAPWSRGGLDARVGEAAAAVDAAKAQQRAVENVLRLSVQEAFGRVKAAEQRAALLRTTIVPQSQQALDISRVSYQTDRVDFLALLDNERVLLDTRLAYYRALSDFQQALTDLERAVGADLTPDMLRPSARED